MSSNEYEERISHGCLAVFLSEREMFTRLKTRRTRNSPKRSPTSRLLCRDLSESPSNLRHLERKKDLRNDRFRMDNGRHLANIISLIAHRHRPLRLPSVGSEKHEKMRRTSPSRSSPIHTTAATDTSQRETDKHGVQMGRRRKDPINTRHLSIRDNTDPIRATPTRTQER